MEHKLIRKLCNNADYYLEICWAAVNRVSIGTYSHSGDLAVWYWRTLRPSDLMANGIVMLDSPECDSQVMNSTPQVVNTWHTCIYRKCQ